MPALDYSRFDKVGDSDDEDQVTKHRQLEAEKEASAAAAADATLTLKNALAGLEGLRGGAKDTLTPALGLVLAARHGQTNVVEALLDASAPVDSVDPRGGTALLRSIDGGTANKPTIELLLHRRASVTVKDAEGRTPLSRAASLGPVVLLETLLQGSAISSRDSSMTDALHSAACAKNLSTSRLLLSAGVPAVGAVGVDETPLHRWAEVGEDAHVQELLNARAVLDACDRDGRTPLLRAAAAGRTPVVGRLLAFRASTSVVAADGRTALAMAAEKAPMAEASAVVKALLDSGASPELGAPLVGASLMGRDTIAAQLLEAKADVNAADHRGCLPLPCAAACGGAEALALCRRLVEFRAIVDARWTSGSSGGTAAVGTSGATALSIAVASGNTALMETLLVSRANLEVLDERGRTPLLTAAVAGQTSACAALLAARARVNARESESEKTALVLAASAGHEQACRKLMEARANVNALTSSNVTALHASAANGHTNVCRVLLAGGASPEISGPGGKNAAALAAAAGFASLAEELGFDSK